MGVLFQVVYEYQYKHVFLRLKRLYVVEVFDNIDEKLHAFDLLFNEILDRHPLIRSIQVRGKPNPCITEEIRELMKSRNVWRKTAHRTNDPHAWSTYKNLKHQVRKLIRAAESEFIKDQIQNTPRNTNCIWKAYLALHP